MQRPSLVSTLHTLAVLIVLAFTPALAAQQHDPHAGHNMTVGYVPREILERPVGLREGIGSLREAVTTASKEAQAFYDQGLVYLHSYQFIEAARSFNQALRLDPKMTMAYVGLSRTYSSFFDERPAREALERAQALAAGANEWERQRIRVRNAQIEAVADARNRTKHEEYKRVIDEALGMFPKDAELWIIRGNAEESSPEGRGQRGLPASIAFYEAALRRVPDHLGAHHYLIHSYEMTGHMEEALFHGEAFARLSPQSPHAQHMYGHDLRRVGRIEEAIVQFRKAYDLEKAYHKTENISRDYDWHHGHNLSLLALCYQYQGRMKQAEELLREENAVAPVGAGAESSRKDWPEFLINRARWPEAAEAARTMQRGRWSPARALGHVLVGSVHLAANDLDKARTELAAAEKETAAGSESVATYLEVLRGEIMLRSDRRAEGSAMLKDVQRKIRALPGPDNWIMALFRLEQIAHTARAAGDWELAEFTARQMLEHDQFYAGAHYALALVAEHRGDAGTQRREFATAEKLWAKADPNLPELARIREKLVVAESR